MVTAVSNNTSIPAVSTGGSKVDTAAMQDRFLTLLVAQINNQDPLNPMDNAQMTSQMAQINTVNGIHQVNDTLTGMATQMATMQAMQGTTLVGRGVMIAGNTLSRDATGLATGTIQLATPADTLKVEVMSPNGALLDSFDLGAQPAGRVSFDWNAASYQGSGTPVFRVNASRQGQPVSHTTLVQDKVRSISSDSSGLTLHLQGGSKVAYADVASFL